MHRYSVINQHNIGAYDFKLKKTFFLLFHLYTKDRLMIINSGPGGRGGGGSEYKGLCAIASMHREVIEVDMERM